MEEQKFFKFKETKPPKSDWYLHITGRNWVGKYKPNIYWYDKENNEWVSDIYQGRNQAPLYWAYVEYPKLPILEKINGTGKTYPCKNCIGDYLNDHVNKPDPKCTFCGGDGLTKDEYKWKSKTVDYLEKV